uniref:Uncharacterized protein n=1 Tax=Gossypium raimondii TaxID=29730 RepID=A0A0D2U451_GOSRA|nr:hypothetical protein B456_013G198000 [Gossypium raimondii]
MVVAQHHSQLHSTDRVLEGIVADALNAGSLLHCRPMLNIENQLLFFVLLTLYGMIEPNLGSEGHLYRLATSALSFFDKGILEKIVRSEDNFQTSRNLRPSATELEDVGIYFFGAPIQKMQDREQGVENMFDIKFHKNTKKLKIPTLQVCDSTEYIFQNYMAYEQLFTWEVPTFFFDYMIFIDKLINTSKDVELLQKSGIIDNFPKGFYYNEIANQVNKHCKRDWNKWKAKLKKDYFQTPWSPISFLAALVLLLLTIL